MEVEFRVKSDHLDREDPATEPTINEYKSPFWPFGEGRRPKIN